MFQKKIICVFLIFFFLEGCKPSPQVSSTTYPKDGEGTMTYSDGSKYVGNFKDGKYNGKGTLTSPDDFKYDGNFRENKFNGKGTLTLPDGYKYDGNFRENRFNGKGTIIWPSGLKYVGDFKDDKFNGIGTFTLPSGLKYVGSFKDCKYNDKGTLIWPSGLKYVGNFKGGKYNGIGTFTWPSGLKYVGDFKNSQSIIQGEYFLLDGSKYKGWLQFSICIDYMFKDSQAEQVGLRVGDIVVRYSDIPITDDIGLIFHLSSTTNPKDKITLEVLRNKTRKSFILNGGNIGIRVSSYPIIPINVIKAINVAKKS